MITSLSLSKIIQKLGKGLASLMIALLNLVVSLQSQIFYFLFDFKTSIIVIGDT